MSICAQSLRLDREFSRVYDGVELILSGQMDKAMNLYNR